MNRTVIAAFAILLVWRMAAAAADERESEVQLMQPGVRLSLMAEHPSLATPTGIDVDSDGQIWLVATHTHFRPDDYVGPEHDEILVFADGDGDGTAERRRVFWSKTEATMDLELGPDGWVYLAERDRILRVRDSDNDGTGDDAEDLVELKTEADYPHNGLEALAWHPDGDLIFGLGENFARPWTLTGIDGNRVSGTGEGGIFRCTPDGKNLRRIASGFWNPFGLCVRDDGEIFAAENDPGERPPCRLLHVVEGGDYGYQRSYGPEAHHPFVAWNGELRGTLPMIHPSGEAPCGVLPLGRGLLVPSWSDHRIDYFRLQRVGASYTAERLRLVQGGKYFRPGCIASVPGSDGGTGSTRTWYLTDWVDPRYQAHGFGRLWKLEIDLSQADWTGPLTHEPPTELARLAANLRNGAKDPDQTELLSLCRHQDAFVARAALIALSRRTSDWVPDDVRQWEDDDRTSAVLALKLSAAAPETWVRMFLADDHPDVQFETLRWIADAGLEAFREDVRQLLDRTDLDFRRFEAAMATWNTINGNSEAGVRNPELLLARVRDPESDPRLRAWALRLLPTQPLTAPADGSIPVQKFPAGLNLELLEALLAEGDATLSREVVRTLAGNAPESRHLLAQIATDPNRSASIRADATAGLAAIADDHVDLLLKLAGDTHRAVREEALRCLRFVEIDANQRRMLQDLAAEWPQSRDLVDAALDPKSLSAGRPPVTDTAAWWATLSNVTAAADPDTGRRLFHHARLAQCANCHRYQGSGNVVGPDLSGVSGRNDRDWLLRAILEPSRDMAPEYQPRTIVLKDGRTFTGIRLRSSTHEAMRDTYGQNRTFDRNDIESMVESTVSFMPAGLTDSLTTREVRDLIAFLSQGSSAAGPETASSPP